MSGRANLKLSILSFLFADHSSAELRQTDALLSIDQQEIAERRIAVTA